MPFIAIALLVAAALGGGTALAAQGALPGDPLWSFKVNVNESIEAAFSTSPSARADWDIGAIQSRLSEAQTLAAQGKLNPSVQADLAANISVHAQSAARDIGDLESSGDAAAAADAATRFQATIAQYLSASSGEKSSATSSLGQAVRSMLNEASKLSAQASASGTQQ